MAAPASQTPDDNISNTLASGAIPITSSTSPSSTYPPPLPAPFQLTSPAPTLITQGAEALLYRTHFLEPSQSAALKVRPSKSWRHPTLDARLTKQRVLAEARVLVRLSGVEGVEVPSVLSLEWELGRKVKGLRAPQQVTSRGRPALSTSGPDSGSGAWLLMEWIEGKSVKELLRAGDLWCKTERPSTEEINLYDEEHVKPLLRRIGKAIAAMQSKGGTVHGDLTTSNIMVRARDHGHLAVATDGINGSTTTHDDHSISSSIHPPDLSGEIVLIDFGLATQSIQDEDRAVDLYVLERAFGSTHPRQEGWFDAEVLQSTEGYRGAFKGSQVVLKRLEEVRMRGRKRSMIG